MWEATLASSHGAISVRRILNCVLATIVAAFLWIIFSAPLAHAATEASWNGASITYEGNSYTGPTDASTTSKLNLPENTKAYTYVDPAPSGVGNSTRNVSRNIHVIYFPPDVDVSTATGAKYKTYIYQGPSSFSGPSSPVDISIGAQSVSSGDDTTSSCDVKDGLGWIICPVTKTLATGMDWVFKILASFLAVRPAETGQDTVLLRAWGYMRSFANMAFVIAFLIIIYSQLTSVGLNNYSIKKLLPRLIIAAVLVNISYYICSVAIDISNILGYSLQDVFIQIRNSLVGSGGNSWDVMSWESLSSFVLSGGTIATAGGIALFTTLSTYGLGGSLFLLLPGLVAGLMAVLIALIVMAARQAVITLLVILAPLAFVAYLLPNTEKWFDKWRSTFMTLLILFPAFSLIFGGSQLAATAIIQNADSINIVILGMLVQVAPLFVTPMLIKLSGSLVGRIAGIINNPNKGIVDRTRNWSKEHADDVKAKRLGTPARRAALLKRNAQRSDHNRRKRETRRKLHESMADNRFMGSTDNAKFFESQREVETTKKTIEGRLARDLDIKMQETPRMLQREMDMRVVTDEANTAKARIDKIHEDLRAGKDTSVGKVLVDLTERSEFATRNMALTAIATQTAKRLQQNQLADALLKNSETDLIDNRRLREYAGGIDEANGADSALAMAISVKQEADAKVVNERSQLIRQFNLSGGERQKLAMGGFIDKETKEFVELPTINVKYKVGDQEYDYSFMTDDTYSRSAAISTQLKIGAYEEKEAIIAASGTRLVKYKEAIAQGIAANGLGSSAIFFGGKTIDDVGQGKVTGPDVLEKIAADYILAGKFKAEELASNDAGAIKVFLAAAKNKTGVKAADYPEFYTRVQNLKEMARNILDPATDVGSNTTQATKSELERLIKEL